MGERTSSGESNIQLIHKVLLGIGFLVQGLRCFPWRAVRYFLKDSLNADSAAIQAVKNTASLPMVAKPLYGIISDAFFIGGQHRIPYIAFGAFLQTISWLAIGILSSTDIVAVSVYLLVSNLGASIAEVANDAIVAELQKQLLSSGKGTRSASSGELQSFVWMASSLGGVIGNLLSGIAIDRFSAELNFVFFGLLAAIQFLLTIRVKESSLNLPMNPSHEGMKKQLSNLWIVLKRPEIAYSIIWFAASFAVIPDLTGTIFFYRTQHLKLDKSLLGVARVLGQAAVLLWSVVYKNRLKTVPARKLIFNIQVTFAIFAILDALYVEQFFEKFGISDSVYAIIFSGFLEVLLSFKTLPFIVLMAQQCPPGCEGSLMAFVMSSIELALIVSGYWGIAVASFFGVTGDNFEKLWQAISIQAACTLLPLFWSSWIPDDSRSRRRKKKVKL